MINRTWLMLAMALAAVAATAEPPQVTVDEHHAIAVNGKKILPICVWAQPESTFPMWKELGVNWFITGSHPRKGGTLDEYLKAAEAQQAWVSVGYRWAQQEGKLDAVLKHPLVLTLHHPDEPDKPAKGEGEAKPRLTPEQMLADYQAIKAADPKRLVSLCLMARFMDEVKFKKIPLEMYQQYPPATDLLMFDLYPVSIWGKYLHWNALGLDKLRGLAGPKKPIGIWLQASDGMNAKDPGLTPAQIRANAWLALIHGATFIGYFPQVTAPKFKFHNLNAERRAALKGVNQEITALADLILTAPKTDLFAIKAEGARVDVMQREAAGKALLVLVNVDENGEGKPATVTVVSGSFKTFAPSRYGSQEELPTRERGVWLLELKPWETAVVVAERAK